MSMVTLGWFADAGLRQDRDLRMGTFFQCRIERLDQLARKVQCLQ